MNPPCASTPVQLHRGFTLVEIMIAVVILGILITIAVPTYRHFQRKAENTTFINNLRDLCDEDRCLADFLRPWHRAN
jgi:prepilin-type N-terminal cleavage/methylation domain-containing protein